MVRHRDPSRPRRNSAPLWKKLSVVLAAPLAVILVIRVLHVNELGFFLFFLVVVAVAAVAVWGTAKLLGVRLSRSSWD